MTEPIITLTYSEVRAAAKKAFDENRLQAQHFTGGTMPFYNKGGFVCAIGAALPKEVAERFDAGEFDTYGIGALCEAGVVSSSEKDRMEMIRLQGVHDRWLRYGGLSRKDEFKRLVYAED